MQTLDPTVYRSSIENVARDDRITIKEIGNAQHSWNLLDDRTLLDPAFV